MLAGERGDGRGRSAAALRTIVNRRRVLRHLAVVVVSRDGFISRVYETLHPRRVPRPRPFGYSSTGDEIAARTFSAAGLQVWNGMMVCWEQLGWTSTECARPSERRLNLQSTWQLRLSKCTRLLYHPPPE
jgi:hypothetical protein